jgi:hypothetical protein
MTSDAQWLIDRYDKAAFIESSVSRGLPVPTGFTNGKPQYDTEVDWSLVEEVRRAILHGGVAASNSDQAPQPYTEPIRRRRRRRS